MVSGCAVVVAAEDGTQGALWMSRRPKGTPVDAETTIRFKCLGSGAGVQAGGFSESEQ